MTGAEQVCGGDVDLLGALVDKSLLVLAGDRYRMLETIREYGLQRLREAGETEQLRLAHARYLLDLAGRAEPELRRAGQLSWLHRLGAEHDNLQAAVRAAVDARDAGTARALTARLGWYWWLRGHRAEGCLMAREVLGLGDDEPGADLALVYAYAALNGLEGAAQINQVEHAARMLGAADAVRRSRDRSVPDADRIAAEARAALGDAGYQEAYDSGAGVAIETALPASGLQEPA